MKKTFNIIQNYLLIALPFVLVCMVWSTFLPNPNNTTLNWMLNLLWEVFSWNLILWFATLLLYLVFLLSSSFAREQTLRKIGNLQERDERESLITGKATKAAYLSTLAVLIALLFISIFQVNVTSIAPKEINGHSKMLNIGLSFDLIDKKNPQSVNNNDGTLFDTKDIPLSKTALLLLIVLWQIGSYNFYLRKELNR